MGTTNHTEESSYALIVRAAAGDEVAEAKVSATFLAGLRKWFKAGEQRPLTDYLPGIAGHDRRMQKRAMRDYWLIRAHRLCSGETDWLKTVDLSRQVQRFRSAIWPSWRDLESPPSGSSELRSALFNAFRLAGVRDSGGCAIPETPRRLYDLVKSSPNAISEKQAEDATCQHTTQGAN